MSMQNNPEEVDLLQFFTAIGKMFKGLFKSIESFFKKLIEIILDFILYLKKHYIFLSIGFLTGLILSFFMLNEESYMASARVRTNFNSQLFLHEQVDLINDLIKEESYDTLAKLFNTKEENVSHLLLVKIKPVYNDVLLIDNYEDYLLKKDTVVYKFIKFKDYKKSIVDNPLLNNFWDIQVYVDQPVDLSFLNTSFPEMFNRSADLMLRKENALFALQTKKQKYLKSLQDIDSLRNVYNQVMLELAKNNNSTGTNIVLASDKARGLESSYNLFSERYRALEKIDLLSQDLSKYSDILVFMNKFPNMPVTEKTLTSNVHVKYSLFGFLLVLMIFLFKDFLFFLNKYQQQKERKKNEN